MIKILIDTKTKEEHKHVNQSLKRRKFYSEGKLNTELDEAPKPQLTNSHPKPEHHVSLRIRHRCSPKEFEI
jgi:hypothetical protein